MTIITILYFILILGIIVFVHEFGHFIFAKRAGIYVYEFSLGMGPRLFKFKRKNDETTYAIRALPIGGFVQLAGEDPEADKDIPKDKRLQSKTWMQRLLTMAAGVTMNFILAIIILFIIALCNGVSLDTRYVTEVDKTVYTNLVDGDKIIKVNGRTVNNYDKLALEIAASKNYEFDMTVVSKDNVKKKIHVKAKKVKDDDKNTTYDFGFKLTGKKKKGLLVSIQYAFLKFFSTIEQMIFTLIYLFTGRLSVKMLSGPVGLYSIVGQAANGGIFNVLSLIALFSINVGFINILPFPAFDGGWVMFLIIEKIKGRPVKDKTIAILNTIGFYLLMLLMVYITFNDILKFF